MVENLANAASDVSKLRNDINDAIPKFLKPDVSGQKQHENIDITSQIKWNDVEGLTEYQKELLKDEYGWSEEKIGSISSWEDAEELLHEKENHRTPVSNGEWSGDRGESTWHPDREYTPPGKQTGGETRPAYNNPEGKAWGELLDKYGIDGVEFKDGFPDFSSISRGTVEIEGFETGGNVEKNRNFNRAYVALADQRGCSPYDVKTWISENNYTWHECEDKRTMQKVPNEIHANIPHDGGRSQE